MLGLPDHIRAVLFDLDGVLTPTALVHKAAWKETFDEFLRARAGKDGTTFEPFTDADYNEYVDGRPRADGVRTFLASRGIELPDGDPDDPPTAETVQGLANSKNERLVKRLRRDGVDAYPGSRRYLDAVRKAGLATAVVSASANTVEVLKAAGLDGDFDARVDGVVATERHLKGKPRPDTFLEGARRLQVDPADAAVFEDAIAGVEAGKAGHFGFVVGVNRLDPAHAQGLEDKGADVVVADLADLLGDDR